MIKTGFAFHCILNAGGLVANMSIGQCFKLPVALEGLPINGEDFSIYIDFSEYLYHKN